MSKVSVYISSAALFFSLLHLSRDISQDLEISNSMTTVLHMDRNWCGSVCNWITYPFEIYMLVASVVILKRRRFGTLGTLIIGIWLMWSAMFLYDYVIFNA